MKSTHALRLLTLAGLGALSAVPALANDDNRYFYGGLSVGQSRAQLDEDRLAASQLGAGLTTSTLSSDSRDIGYKVFGGYQFNRHWGLEAGYFDLGKFDFNATTLPAGTLKGETKLRGYNLDLVATLPLTHKLSALARVGVQRAKASGTFSGTGAVTPLDTRQNRNATNAKYGVGLQYAFTDSFLMRGEAERYRVNDTADRRGNVNLFSLSLVFPFGRTHAEAPRAAAPAYVAPAPERVAVTPEPAPAPAPAVVAPVPVAPVVVAPARQRVSFSADSLFSFDKAEVGADGKMALDKFASETKGTRFEQITVEGHTDRLGSEAYNQRLSLQRAEAVKSYLVNTGGFDGAKIATVGKGESTPVTQPGDCKGNKRTAKLIACLQPDRRVEVEVVGTR